jgi:tetratricopeptide (TPR) repeat protein
MFRNYIQFAFLFLCFLGPATSHSVAQGVDTTIYVRADYYNKTKNYTELLKIFDTLLAAYPHAAQYIAGKSYLLSYMDRKEEAEKLINDFMDKGYEKSAVFYFVRAGFKKDAKLYNTALNDYNEAFMLDKDIDSLYYKILLGRSDASLSLLMYNDAYNDASRYLDYDSTNIDAMITLVNALNWLGDTTRIIKYLEMGLRQYPASDILVGNLAYAYENMGRYQDAIEVNNKALKLDSTKSYYFNNRGFEKYKLNDLQGALTDINRALQVNPDNAFAYKNKALVYLAMNDRETACKNLNTAIDKKFTEQYGREAIELLNKNCGK